MPTFTAGDQRPSNPGLPLVCSHVVVALATLLVIVVQLWLPAFAERSFGIRCTVEDGKVVLTVRDFTAAYILVQAVWRHGPDWVTPGSQRPGYDAETALEITRQWACDETPYALPLPWSPTILWLFGPLCLLPMVAAYILFTAVGWLAIVWVTRRPTVPTLASRMVMLSPLGLACFAFGQSALLTLPAMMHLASRGPADNSPRSAPAWQDALGAAVILWCFTAKPNWAVTVGAALLALRWWRPVVLAVALTLVTTLLATPLLGPDWPSGYMALMGRYNKDQLSSVFAWSIHPESMTNVRALLHIELQFSDAMAFKLSSALWLAGLVAVGLAGLWRKINAWGVWSLCVLIHLLFSPHVSFYEDLHLCVLLALPLDEDDPGRRLTTRLVLCLLIPCCMWLSPGLGPLEGLRPPVLLFLKLLAVPAITMLAWNRGRITARRAP